MKWYIWGLVLVLAYFYPNPIAYWGLTVIGILAFVFLLSSIEDWWLTKQQNATDRATHNEDQIADFIDNYVSDDTTDMSRREFKKSKALLMADYLDTHPHNTRIDFEMYFDEQLRCAVHSSNP